MLVLRVIRDLAILVACIAAAWFFFNFGNIGAIVGKQLDRALVATSGVGI